MCVLFDVRCNLITVLVGKRPAHRYQDILTMPGQVDGGWSEREREEDKSDATKMRAPCNFVWFPIHKIELITGTLTNLAREICGMCSIEHLLVCSFNRNRHSRRLFVVVGYDDAQ